MKRIIAIAILMVLGFLLFRGYNMSVFYFPDRLAIEYIDSIFDADIRKSKYLETGKENAIDDFFGILTMPILEAYRRAEKIERDEITFKTQLKSEFSNKRIYEITFKALDIGFLVRKVREYTGYIKNIDGKLVDVPGKYPNLTDEEAFALVRKNESIPVSTKALPLEVVKKNNMWFVGDSEEIWYYLHPDLEQYRTIIPK